MKKRFIVFNISILIVYIIVLAIGFGYNEIRSYSFGEKAKSFNDYQKQILLDRYSKLQFSIYHNDVNELERVKSDITKIYPLKEFKSITIQEQASFIDSLLYDSDIVKYMRKSKFSNKNKSLLNNLKLFLPNELLINFGQSEKNPMLISAIEDYLVNQEYSFIQKGNLPSVKSNIKHYYYNKSESGDIMMKLSDNYKIENLRSERDKLWKYIMIAFSLVLCLILVLLVRLLDQYFRLKYLTLTKLLLQGRVNPVKYFKLLAFSKSFVLLILLVVSSYELIYSYLIKQATILPYHMMLAVISSLIISLLIININKEKIEL